VLDDQEWATAEHHYQAQKFVGTAREHAEAIRLTRWPYKVWHLGQNRDVKQRPDGPVVKDDVMRRALRAKFEQNPELREPLLATGEAHLIEHTATDSYWGDGGDGSGLNRLGELLMELRAQLRTTPGCSTAKSTPANTREEP
jgi:ribA/ribD-fused uncharacterized protein